MVPPIRLLVITMVGASLLACSKQSNSERDLAFPRGSASGHSEDRFGKTFGTAFRADSKSRPMDVRGGDLPPVSSTAEPLPVD